MDLDDKALLEPAVKVKRAFAIHDYANMVLIEILHSRILGNLQKAPDPEKKPSKIVCLSSIFPAPFNLTDSCIAYSKGDREGQ